MIDTFDELSDLSRKLNQASDRINSTISTINSKLNRLNLGVEVWLEHATIKSTDWEAFNIGYCEIEGEWQLAVRRSTCEPNSYGPIEDVPSEAIEVDYRPLLKAGRGLRLDALSLIPKLVDEIKQRVESLLKEIAEVENSAEKL